MRIGLFAPAVHPAGTPEYLRTLGTTAEERGFHSIWMAEHVVLFDDYASRYPYAANGRIPAAGESGFFDPFDALSFLAAHTARIRLGTGICLVPQRNPVYTAKHVAGVDCLSGGRFDFGVGVGWLAEEFSALEVPFERRATAAARPGGDRRLRCDPVSTFTGAFYGCRHAPVPEAIRPHPPIYFGGRATPPSGRRRP
jgi:alkanesulfonate monooxygenase SsuD/methylene tetrahydromethanopterin reductase-like flavin-dependent oxidoreductase (luciferase family)